MRAIGAEMITFGAGLPVLYFTVGGIVLHGLSPAGTVFVGALSFVLIALGREVRLRAARSNK